MSFFASVAVFLPFSVFFLEPVAVLSLVVSWGLLLVLWAIATSIYASRKAKDIASAVAQETVEKKWGRTVVAGILLGLFVIPPIEAFTTRLVPYLYLPAAEDSKALSQEDGEYSDLQGRDSTRIVTLVQMQLALTVFYDDKGYYPSTFEEMVHTYFSEVPEDPLGGAGYYYRKTGVSSYDLRTDLEGDSIAWFMSQEHLDSMEVLSHIAETSCTGLPGRHCLTLSHSD